MTLGLKGQQAVARGLKQTGDAGRGMARGMREDFRKLNEALNGFSAASKLVAQAGGLYAARQLVMQSAQLDKSLIRVALTAGMTRKEMAAMRAELFAESKRTGQSVDDLKNGLDNAVQSGLNFRQALPVMKAVNTAMAVTAASSTALTSALTVGATAYQFDLEKPGQALLMLDQMRVAAKLGNAELGSLSSIFSRVGVNAASAGMSYSASLGFIEALSRVEMQPERLATLVDSTLRVFTNKNYMKDAQGATGIRFFDAKGQRRDAVAVLADIKSRYDKLKTDAERFKFISKAFGQADLDTVKGIKTLMTGDILDSVKRFSGEIERASGTLERELPAAMNDAVDQGNRLKAVMAEAADGFVQPINGLLAKLFKIFADTKEQGGIDVSGGALAAGTLGALAMGRLAWKKYRGDKPGLLEQLTRRGGAGGVQQVFVTNWPGGMLGPGEALKQKRAGGSSGGGAAAGGAATGASRGARVLSGARGAFKYGALTAGAFGAYDAYGAFSNPELSAAQKKLAYGRAAGGTGGSILGATIGGGIGALFGGVGAVPGALIGGAIGNWLGEQAGEAISKSMAAAEPAKVGGEVNIRIHQDGRAGLQSVRSTNPRVPLNVDVGRTMVMP